MPVYTQLVMEERERLASILNDPVFVKAWNNAELSKPSCFHGDPAYFDGQFGDNRAAKTLHRIQGWELHKAALIRESVEKVKRSIAPPEEYPDSGTIEAQLQRKLSTQAKK